VTYTYGNYIDEVLTRTTNPESPVTLYCHQNSLWSVHALTDASGNVVERYSYDAYGKPSFFDGSFNPQPSSLVTNRILFTGREWDAECWLFHYRARAYSPTLGRFTSRDPLGYVGGKNLYEYVKGRPINRIDPTGKCGCNPPASPDMFAVLSYRVSGYDVSFRVVSVDNAGGGCFRNVEVFWTTCWLGTVCPLTWIPAWRIYDTYNPYEAYEADEDSGPFSINARFRVKYEIYDCIDCKWKNKDVTRGGGWCYFIHLFPWPFIGDHWECSQPDVVDL
jgi:RHS repeat-associated protein